MSGAPGAVLIVTMSPPRRSLSSLGEPVATILPWSMIASRSHIVSASSK